MRYALATSLLMRGRRMFEHPGGALGFGLLLTTETVHVAPAFGSSLSLDIAWFSRSLGAPALSLTSWH